MPLTQFLSVGQGDVLSALEADCVGCSVYWPCWKAGCRVLAELEDQKKDLRLSEVIQVWHVNVLYQENYQHSCACEK